MPDFQVEKVDLSEIKKVKNLIPSTREFRLFNDSFKITLPEEKEFKIIEGQPIYMPELILSAKPDFDDEISRETENLIFTQEESDTNLLYS